MFEIFGFAFFFFLAFVNVDDGLQPSSTFSWLSARRNPVGVVGSWTAVIFLGETITV